LADASAEGVWKLNLWGDFAVHSPDGANATPKGRKARALLAWLALHPARPISRERLCGLLWGDRAEEQARASLRQTLFELKPFTLGARPLLQVERGHVMLNPLWLATDLQAAALQPAGSPFLPEHDEVFLADLDDVEEGFDDWLRVERRRQAALRLEPANPATADSAAADPPPAPAPLSPPSPGRPPQPPISRRLAAALAAAVLLAAALLIWVAVRPAPVTQPQRVRLAVVPFAGTGSADVGLAQLLADELRIRLAANPGLDLIGRVSSAQLPRLGPDMAAAGRRIGATHLLTGSAAAQEDGVAVRLVLLRSSDGTALWESAYDLSSGRLHSVRESIAADIARVVGVPGNAPEPAPPRADIYALVATAQGLLASLEPARLAAAEELLRRAHAADPADPRAAASLAQAIMLQLPDEPTTASERARAAEAARLARAALRADPDLADTQVAMADILPTHPDPGPALAHLEAATRLDPSRADVWVRIWDLHMQRYDHVAAMAAVRRAVALEPFWWVAYFNAGELAWDLGLKAESAAIYAPVLLNGSPFQNAMARCDVAFRVGDFSAAAAAADAALSRAQEGERRFADSCRAKGLRAAGLPGEARTRWRFYPVTDEAFALWQGRAPSPSAVARYAAEPARFWAGLPIRHLMLRSLVNEGRTAEVVRFYDLAGGTPEALAARNPRLEQYFAVAPSFVIALRASGRNPEAARLLRHARSLLQPALAAPLVHRNSLALDAALLALEGRQATALDRLEQAHARGWLYNRRDEFPDIALEPAYRTLADSPRFQRIRAAQNGLASRERAEIQALSPALRTN
jgi:TolB-like protein